jgi:hypothetical protein
MSLEMMLHDLKLMKEVTDRRIVFDCMDSKNVDMRPDDLVFQSNFESGNCRRAIRITDYEYDIITNTDVNCTTHTQVFFIWIYMH